MADEPKSTIDRRRFLTVLGASGGGALALSGCSTDQVEKLIPYLVQSEDQVPGVATWYSSTCTECSTGCGLHVRTREGRAVKLEGNPEHPVNQGKLCSRGQAGLQGLYNPGRLKGPMARGANGQFQEITWDDAIARLAGKLGAAGNKVAVISGAGRGTFSDLLGDWVGALGGRLVRYEPFASEPLRAANRQVFGLDQLAAHDFARAKYIVSFGADFLDTGLASIEHARGFAQSHGFAERDVAKFVYLAPRMDLTGLNADQWHPIRPGSEAALALAMANVLLTERGARRRGGTSRRALGLHAGDGGRRRPDFRRPPSSGWRASSAPLGPAWRWPAAAGSQHAGATEVCAAVNILNYVAGNIGETVRFGADLDTGDGYAALQPLAGRARCRPGGRRPGARGQSRVHLAPVQRLRRQVRRRPGSRSRPRCTWTRPRLSAISCCPSITRWSAGTICGHGPGVHSLMQPVMEPVFNTLADRRPAAPDGQGDGRAARPVHRSLLSRTTCRPAGRRWPPIGGERDFAAFWHGALQRGGVFAEAPAAPPGSARSRGVAGELHQARLRGRWRVRLRHLSSRLLYDGRGSQQALAAGEQPIRSPRSPGIPGSRSIPRPPASSTSGTARSCGSPPRTAPSKPRSSSIRASTRTSWRCRSDSDTPSTAPTPGAAASMRSTCSARRRETSCPTSPPGCRSRRPAATRRSPRLPATRASSDGASPKPCPLDAAKKGLTVEQAYLAEGHGKHEINTERELEAIKGWSEEQDPGHASTATTPATIPAGAWRSTWRSAPAARPASPRATPRTTFRRWARGDRQAAAR